MMCYDLAGCLALSSSLHRSCHPSTPSHPLSPPHALAPSHIHARKREQKATTAAALNGAAQAYLSTRERPGEWCDAALADYLLPCLSHPSVVWSVWRLAVWIDLVSISWRECGGGRVCGEGERHNHPKAHFCCTPRSDSGGSLVPPPPPICPPAALPPLPPPPPPAWMLPCGSALNIYICLVSYRVVSSRYAWFVSWYIINKVPFYTPSLLFLVYFLCRMCLAPVSSCRYYAPGTKTGEEGTTMRAREEHEKALFADPVAMLR